MQNHKGDIRRSQILLAATELFARHGFKGTSIRSICQQADCNIASINYYFGSKQLLYETVVRDMFRDLLSNIEGVNKLALDEASWEQALHTWIHEFLHTLLTEKTPQKWLSVLCSRELSDPSPASGRLFEQFFVPILNELRELVRMGLPPDTPLVEEQAVVVSVLAQCLLMANRSEPWSWLIKAPEISTNEWIATYGHLVMNTLTSRLRFQGRRADS